MNKNETKLQQHENEKNFMETTARKCEIQSHAFYINVDFPSHIFLILRNVYISPSYYVFYGALWQKNKISNRFFPSSYCVCVCVFVNFLVVPHSDRTLSSSIRLFLGLANADKNDKEQEPWLDFQQFKTCSNAMSFDSAICCFFCRRLMKLLMLRKSEIIKLEKLKTVVDAFTIDGCFPLSPL